MSNTRVSIVASIGGAGDGVVVVAPSTAAAAASNAAVYTTIAAAVDARIAIDSTAASGVSVVAVSGVAGGRVFFSPTGPLDRDYDDARRWPEAAAAGVKRALECGCRKLTLAIVGDPSWPQAQLLGVMGALDAAYVPLEVREEVPNKKIKISELAVFGVPKDTVNLAVHLDQAKSIAKDIGGSDPERMAPPRVEDYVKEVFSKSSCIKLHVIDDDAQLQKNYPLFEAVNRCAKGVPRHRGRIIMLHYTPPTKSKKTVMLVGKGVTYDTGGADIKAGGVMAGMHRDKCGAAAVTGYFKFLDLAKPDGIEVYGALCMVRNSVGSDCYVADEIITSRAGVRIRVGNTDAEGRMAMADSLAYMKEIAINKPDASLFTVATLTGHCCLAIGEGYTAIMENGPAKRARVATHVQNSGELMAEPVEVSSIRREDYAFHRGKSEYEDVLQCNNLPSSRTPRGHQSPAAFLILASGLDKHGKDSAQPLQYSHMDIAASSGPFPGLPTGAPVLALARTFSPELFLSATQ
uniref:Aminopeptidase W07G4.4 n=1 Tax=Hirondellea gigas TaxID=1518452 RepID=A0A2P2HXD0_9CRUS